MLKSSIAKSPKSVLITTPIFYINSKPHIGHIYTLVYSNFLKNLHISSQKDQQKNRVFLSTGVDEHGLKVFRSSLDRGHKSTQSYADEMSELFRSTVDELQIDYDIFQRTTDPDHKKNVEKTWQYFSK